MLGMLYILSRMKNLTETFLVNEALLAIAAPDFPLMREEWAAEDAEAAAHKAWLDSLDEWYERMYSHDPYPHDDVLS